MFCWNTENWELLTKTSKAKLPKGSRGITAWGISAWGKYIACSDNHNDHHVSVYEINSGKRLFSENGGPDKIWDISWAKDPNNHSFLSVGIKHVKYWTPFDAKRRSRMGIYGKTKRTNFGCVTADNKGNFFSGGANGEVYVWKNNACSRKFAAHAGVI